MATTENEVSQVETTGSTDSKENEVEETMWVNPQSKEYMPLLGSVVEYKVNPFDVRILNGVVEGGVMRFNPIVFFLSIAAIWSFVIWCAAEPEVSKKETDEWNEFIVGTFGWFYIASVAFFGVYDVYLCFSKYGDIVLGKDNEAPKYSYASWFAMLFSAGVGIGLFFYGVTEPVCHYASSCWGGWIYPRRWAKLPRYERAIMAMNVTWFHWGLAPSACYCIVGLPLAFLVHRKGMPITMRTIFYPMMGDTVWGPIGDIIDVFAIMGTMFGIATSLGLGVFQMATAINRINSDIDDSEGTRVWIIWIVTIFATISVMTGLDYGIRRISESTFTLGIFMLGMLLMMGNTWFLLSLGVETFGSHIWYLMDLEFHTDPTQQLDAISPGGESIFMSFWTVFYWGWWISWAPFVGVFIAQISQGRTVREFILGNMFVPTILTSAWFIITGGLGIEMEMRAESLGVGGNQHLRFPNLNTNTFQTKTYNAGQCEGDDGCAAFTSSSSCTMNEANLACTWEMGAAFTEKAVYNPAEYEYRYNVPICGSGELSAVKEADNDKRLLRRLSCRTETEMLFDVLEYYGEDGMYKFVRLVALIALVFYFVTSSDSGSHVIDMMCSNGDEDPPLCQRIFWAVSEGAVAHVLITSGEGTDALKSLRGASIAAGLPFCAIMLAMCYCTQKMFHQWEVEHPNGVPNRMDFEAAEKGPRTDWDVKILHVWHDTLLPLSTCGAELCGFTPFGERKRSVMDVIKAVVAPFMVQMEINERAGIQRGFASHFAAGSFFCWILFEFLELAERHMAFVGWSFYAIFVGCMTAERMMFRDELRLNGHPMEDAFILCFCYPCAVLQEQSEVEAKSNKKQDAKKSEEENVELVQGTNLINFTAE